MATAYIRFGRVMGGGAPVYSPTPNATATITTSGTSQATTVSAQEGDFIRVTASGGAIRIAIGAAPVALAGSGDWLLDGDTMDLGPLKYGDKIAVIDLS